MAKRLAELGFAAGICALSVWLWFVADGFASSPRYAQVDTDYWPKIVFGLLALTTGLLAVQNLFALIREPRQIREGPLADWQKVGRMVLMGALVLAYFLAFDTLGFALSTILFLWIAAFILPTGRPWIKIVFAPVFTLILILLFSRALALPLPRGVGPFFELSLWLY